MMSPNQPVRQLSVRVLVRLSIIPAMLFISSLILTSLHGPYYLGSNFDPEYAYLLNSLNILLGETPGHTDHPGTSVQLLGAAVIGGQYGLARVFGVTEEVLETAVITNPESYLRTINLFFNFSLALGSFMVGYRVFRYSNRWLFVAILQIVPFLFATTILATTRIMPEPFLLFITYGLVFFLMPIIFNQTYRLQTNRESVFLGIILGLGIVTKVTFIPLLVLLWLPDTFKRKVYASLSMVFTFLLITLPIWNKYPAMVQWLINLIIHDGRHGRGEVGLGNAELLSKNFSKLFVSEPTYFILIGILFFGVAILFWQRQKIKGVVVRRNYFIILALFIIILLGQTILTIKHPPIHYSLPSMGMAGLILLLLISAPITISDRMNKLIHYSIFVFLIGAVGITTVKINERNIIAQDAIDSVENLETLIANSYSHCTIAYYYRSSSIPYALDFGDSYANGNFSQTLDQIYSNELFYHIYSQRFHTSTTFFESSEIKELLTNGGCILMQGRLFANGYEKYATSLTLERVDNNIVGETLYQLNGFKETGTN